MFPSTHTSIQRLNKVSNTFQFCIFLSCQVVDEQTSTVSESESKDNTQKLATGRTDSITDQDNTDHKTEIDNNASSDFVTDQGSTDHKTEIDNNASDSDTITN